MADRNDQTERVSPWGDSPESELGALTGVELRPFSGLDGAVLDRGGPRGNLPRPPRQEFAMAKAKKKREIVHLVCDESGERNYTIRKKPGTPKLELKKYCPRLRKHTLHTEKKK